MRPALVLLAVSASGCAAFGPTAGDAGFSERATRHPTTLVLADVLIAEDVAGDADRVALAPTLTLAQALGDSLAVWLTARGYPVDDVFPPAVGLYFADPSVTYRVRPSAEGPDSVRAAPLVVPPEVVADTLVRTALDPLGAASGLGPPAFGAYETYVVLVVRGRRVSLAKTALQGLAAAVVAAVLNGTGVGAEHSYRDVELVVVDGETGDVIWHDVSSSGWSASERGVWRSARWLVGRLPERAEATAERP